MSFSRLATASRQEIDALNDEKDSKNTKRAITHAVKTLRDYCISRGASPQFEDLSKADLDELLESFYMNLRKQDGELYKSSAFTLIRFGVNKHLSKVKGYDILNDKAFTSSTQIYHSVCTKLKKEGLAIKVHKVPISTADMELLYTCGVFDVNTPTGLLQKVFLKSFSTYVEGAGKICVR